MPEFTVTVQPGYDFDVTAPDEGTAWKWARSSFMEQRNKEIEQEKQGRAMGGQYKIGAEGFRDAAKQVTADETTTGKTSWDNPLAFVPSGSPAGRFLQGMGETADRYALGAKGLFTDLTPEDKLRLQQNKVMTEEGGTAATVGQVAGDLAINYPLMRAGGLIAGAPQVARAAPMLPRALGSLPGRVGTAVASNAAMGALASPEDRATGAAYGAAGGVGGMAANRVVGGVLRPFVGREGRELIEQGIQPTPGQAVGGWVGRTEERLKSVPGVGDLIRRGRNRAIDEYNQALAGRVSQEVTGEAGLPRAAGQRLGAAGDESLLRLRSQIGQVYEDVLDQVPRLRVERQPLERFVAQVASDPALGLRQETAQQLFDYVERHLLADRGGDISGQVAKSIESDLGKVVRRLTSGASTAEERALGEALERVHGFWREGIAASLPNEAQRRMLQNANAAWRAFQPQDVAAAKAGSQLRGGVYSPRVLRSALAQGDKSQSDNVLRELQQRPVAAARTPYEYTAAMSRAGSTLGDVVPDSGTAGRLMTGAGSIGGASYLAGANPIVTAGATAATLGATALMYSRAGSAAITQGVLPATREAVAAWLAQRGVPREVWPTLTEQILAGAARTQPHPLQRSVNAARLQR